MPAAVAAWIATTVGATALGAALIEAAVGLAVSYAVAKINRPKGPRPQDNMIEVRQSDAPRVRYVGRNRVSGALMYQDVHRNVIYNDQGHRLTGLVKLWAVAHGGHNGVVQWYLGETPGRRWPIWLLSRTGKGDEYAGGAYPTLLDSRVPAWTADHRLDGVGTLLMLAANVKAEDANRHYPGGEPKVTAVISGDSCYNPSGDLGPTANIARQLYDILTHPEHGPMTWADMDVASWDQAISDCNNNLPTALGTTRRRYEGGGGYLLSEPIKDVAERWCDAMAATVYLTTDGKVGIRVGKWVPPKYTITEDKIVSMEYGVGADRIDGVGALVPKYTDPRLGYAETSADPWEDAAALARWGETAIKELDLPIVQHHGQARALAKIKLARLNPKWRFSMRLRFWGLLLLEETVVTVNLPRLGIVNEPFWVERYAFAPDADDGVCTVELIHADPASFDWTGADEGTAPALPPTTGGGPVQLDPPTITAVSVDRDGDLPYIRVEALAGDNAVLVGQYRRSGTAQPWTHMQPEGDGGSMRTLPLEDQRNYDLRAAAAPGYNMQDAPERSDWAGVSNITVVANENPPPPPDILAATGEAGGSLSVTFRPGVGANYYRTGLYRAAPGGTFAGAALVAWDYATSAEVTMTATIPAAGGRYWLRSENRSAVASAPVLVGEYI